MMRSTWLPANSSVSMLTIRCVQPPCTSALESGVIHAGKAPGKSIAPERRAGMRPANTAQKSTFDRIATAEIATVRMAMIAVALLSRSTGLDELDLGDFVVAVARRGGHLDLVADLAADQGAAERRIIADPADPGVGFLL